MRSLNFLFASPSKRGIVSARQRSMSRCPSHEARTVFWEFCCLICSLCSMNVYSLKQQFNNCKHRISSLVINFTFHRLYSSKLSYAPIGSSVSQIAINETSHKRPPTPDIKGGCLQEIPLYFVKL